MLARKLTNFIKRDGLFLTMKRLAKNVIRTILMSLTNIYWRLFLNQMGRNVKIHYTVKIDIPSNVNLGDNVYLNKGVRIGSETTTGCLVLENNVQINRDCKIDHSGNVRIKRNTVLSEGVTIFSHSHGYNPKSKPKPIDKNIGENCWLGYGSLVGENCKEIPNKIVIAAKSVVVNSLTEPSSVYGGIPAKFIKRMDNNEI